MANHKPLTDQAGEVRELNRTDFDTAVPFTTLPASLQHKLSMRGPQKEPIKERINRIKNKRAFISVMFRFTF